MGQQDILQAISSSKEQSPTLSLEQKLVPFIEEIFKFVNDVKPLLDEINVSIRDNMDKMPNATQQLSKVTEANENATNEIMDMVDGIMNKAFKIDTNMQRMNAINQDTRNFPKTILKVLAEVSTGNYGKDEILSKIKSEIQVCEDENHEFDELVNINKELSQKISDESNAIMMALQVQDITAQQIAAVSFLMQNVNSRFSVFLENFDKLEVVDVVPVAKKPVEIVENPNITQLHRTIAFDPDAIDTLTKVSQQGDIDDLIASFDPNSMPEEKPVSTPVPAPAPASVSEAGYAPIPALKPAPVEEPSVEDFVNFSQDDIDAMFGN